MRSSQSSAGPSRPHAPLGVRSKDPPCRRCTRPLSPRPRDRRRPEPRDPQEQLDGAPKGAVGTSPRPSEGSARLDAVWVELATALHAELGPTRFRTWFSAATLTAVDDEEVTVALPNDFTRDWIEDHFQTLLGRKVKEVLGGARKSCSSSWTPRRAPSRACRRGPSPRRRSPPRRSRVVRRRERPPSPAASSATRAVCSGTRTSSSIPAARSTPT